MTDFMAVLYYISPIELERISYQYILLRSMYSNCARMLSSKIGSNVKKFTRFCFMNVH